MLLTIFGAGASYDSVDLSVVNSVRNNVNAGISFRPPLANQLFDERREFVSAMNRYPQMSMLVPRLRRASNGKDGRTIEETLRNIQAEAEVYPQRKSHLLALEFYLADVLETPVNEWIESVGRATNYAELLDQLAGISLGSALLFVSFNYDRMLESAISDVLMRRIQDDLGQYLSNDLALIKPHGSVDWVQLLPRENSYPIQGYGISDIIEHAESWNFHEGEIIIRRSGMSNSQFYTAPWHPAVAIPLDRGKTFVCPPEHIQRLCTDLESVSRILVIGWRATEQHFIDMLAQRLPRDRPLSLCIVDKKEGAVTAHRNLEQALGKIISFRPVELYKEGFSDFVREARIRHWLSRPLEDFSS
jgi:hypothetical protein